MTANTSLSCRATSRFWESSPIGIDHGYIAFYAFPDDTTEEKVLEDLDVSSWAFRDLQVLDE